MHAKSNRRYNMMKSFLEEFLMKIQDEMSSLQFLLVAAVHKYSQYYILMLELLQIF